jgi:hypothetical protein
MGRPEGVLDDAEPRATLTQLTTATATALLIRPTGQRDRTVVVQKSAKAISSLSSS